MFEEKKFLIELIHLISPVLMAWTFVNFLSGYVCCQQRRFFGAKKNSKHLDMYWFPPVFNCKHRRGVCVSVSLCCDFTSFCVELTTTIQNWDSLTQALVPASNHLWSILNCNFTRKKMVLLLLLCWPAWGCSLFDLSCLLN